MPRAIEHLRAGAKALEARTPGQLTPAGALAILAPSPDTHMRLEDRPDPLEEPLRPRYHFTPGSGWLNDPVGLVFFQGEYHLFYQHNPAGPTWGEMHWGHAVSHDLLHWEHLPVALYPHQKLGVVFSGSVVVDRENTSGLCRPGEPCLVALFTHAFGEAGTQDQSLAYSHDRGRTWIEYQGNPVLPNPGIADFRDPKVFWHQGGRWIMAVAAGDRVAFYASPDLMRWTHLSDFGPLAGIPEGAWECPDLFPLPVQGRGDSRWILKIDITPGIGQRGTGRYFVGHFDGTRFTPEGPEGGLPLDHGLDFYAAQSFSDVADGRCIWMAWRDSWLYALDTPTEPWRGALTIPRELGLAEAPGGGLVLTQRPVQELDAHRARLLSIQEASVPAARAQLESLSGDSLDITAELALEGAREVGFQLLKGGGEETVVGYDAGRGALFLDRTRSGNVGFHGDFAERHWAPLPLEAGTLRLRILVDRSSVEVFAQDGRTVITDAVYPSPSSRGLSLHGDGARVRHLEVHRITP